MTEKKPLILLVNRKSIAGNNRQSMSVRVRLSEPLLYLESKGKITIVELDESIIEEKDILNSDLIAMSRSYSPVAVKIMKMAQSLSKSILYDVDDDMFVLPKWTALNSVEFENHKSQLEMASVITVPHSLLAERLKFYKDKIYIISTGTLIQKKNEIIEKSKKIIYTNLMDIKLESARNAFLNAVSDFMQNKPSLELDVFSDSVLDICNISNVRYCGFLPYEDYKKKILNEGYLFALCPLSGHEDQDSLRHNECKSPIKYIDYSSAKIPGIFSNSPAYARTIKHGENGYLTENTYRDWSAALDFMYHNEAHCENMAENAFLDILKNYNMDTVSEKWFKVIQNAIAKFNNEIFHNN